MTMTIDISPEAQARLDAEASRQGMDTDEYTRVSFQTWLSLTMKDPDTEESAFADMRALSLPTLQEYWINEEDAVYDTL